MNQSQIVRRLEALEERMGAREMPRIQFTRLYVEACDGRPTGNVTRVRQVNGEEISEEIWIDPEILLRRSQR
jgi:hypothetical protein